MLKEIKNKKIKEDEEEEEDIRPLKLVVDWLCK